MRRLARTGCRVLSLDPFRRGFGYATLEGTDCLVDWGLAYIPRGDLALSVERVEKVIRFQEPELLVLESVTESRRGGRAVNWVRHVTKLSLSLDIPILFVSRKDIKAEFEGCATNKHQVAIAIARTFPDLKERLPKKRKSWASEADRMSIFDAVAFGLTALAMEEQRSKNS